MSCRRQAAGFTLIELLLVISLMAILAGLVLPKSSPTIHDQLQSAAKILVADLAYGRSLAVTHGSRYRFLFDPEGNRYILEHSGTAAALDQLPRPLFPGSDDTPTQHVVDLDELPRLGPGARIAAVAEVASTLQPVSDLEFGPLGETTRSGDTRIWLAAGEAQERRFLVVDVGAVTGLASIGTFSAQPPEI